MSVIRATHPRDQRQQKAVFREKKRASAWWRRGPELVEVLNLHYAGGNTSSVSSVPIIDCAERFEW
jgi:hypothetical protein